MLLLVVALFYVRDVLVLLAVALVVSTAIQGPIEFLEKRKVPRTLSVIIIFLCGAAIVALVLYTLIPVALIQLKYLLANINTLKLPLFELFGASDVVSQLDSGVSGILDSLFTAGSSVAGFVSRFLGNIFFIAISVVLAFYLAISKRGVERFIRAIFPLNREEYAINLYTRTQKKLSRWLSGQMVVSAFVGLLTFIGLLFLGSEYALMLAVLAAVLELVPYVGPIAVGLVAFLISIPQSLTLALFVALLFFVIQQIENHVLSPVVMSKAVGMEPVTVVIAILAGSQLAGLAGIVLAVPFTIVLQELIDDWSLRKHSTQEQEKEGTQKRKSVSQ